MSTKRYKPEQVVNILRQIEVEIANGKTTHMPALGVALWLGLFGMFVLTLLYLENRTR